MLLFFGHVFEGGRVWATVKAYLLVPFWQDSMAMENGPFEDVFSIVEFSIAILVTGDYIYIYIIYFYIFRWEVYSL